MKVITNDDDNGNNNNNNNKCDIRQKHKTYFAGWATLAPSEYTNKIRLKFTDKYYEHTPEKSQMWMVPLLRGMYRLSQIEQYWQTAPI